MKRFFTKRIQAEKKLQESQRDYSTLVESTNDGIIIIQDGLLKFANKKIFEISGHSAEGVIGKPFHDFVAPECRDLVIDRFNKRVSGAGAANNYEVAIVTKENAKIPFEVNANKIIYKNKPAVMAILRDISSRKQAEEELLLQRDFNQSMYNTAQVIMLVLEPDGRISTFNQYMEGISGYKLEEVKGKYWFDVFIPERDREQIKQLFKKAIDNVQTKGNINAIITKDGREREIEWHDKTLKDLDGKVVGLLSVGQDITERKRAEEALKESEEKFSKAFNVSANTICISSLVDNKFMEINEAFTAFTGYTREEVIGHTAAELNLWVTDGEYERLNALLRKERKFQNIEFLSRHKTGEIRIGLGSAENINIGETPCRLVVITDITARKQAETKLKNAEQNFRNSLDNSPLGIFIITRDGELVYANKAMLDIYGYDSFDELRNAPAKERFTADGYIEYLERLEKRKRGEPVSAAYEMDIVRKTGEVRHVASWRKEVVWNSEMQYQVIHQDITEREKAETALRDSEDKFSKAFSASSNAICITSLRDNRFLEINESFTRFTGYTREEAVGRTGDDLKLWMKPEELKRWLDTLRRDGRVFNQEFSSRMKSGEIRIGLASADIVKIGEEPCRITVIADITERKKTEEALMTSEENFRHSLDDSPLGIRILNSDEETLYANQAMLDIFGYASIKEFQSIPAKERFTPEIYEEYQKRKESRKRGEFQPHRVEISIVRKDGEIRHLETIRKEVVWNGEKQYQLINQDITERKQAEQALRRSEENLHHSIDDSPLGIRIVDDDGKTIYANRAILTIYGYESLEELEATPTKKRYTPESYAEHRERVRKRQRGEYVSSRYEISIVRRDGQIRNLDVLRDEVLWDGRIQHQVIYQDITERKQAEKERLKMEEYKEMDRLKTNLLSTVSHELRTPLAVIKGYATLLLQYDKKLKTEQKNESLESIDHATDRLTELIDHLLDMSRLDAGLLRLNMEPINPLDIIFSAIAEAQLRAPKYHIKADISGKLPEITADSKRFRQVLDNLLDNAIKYSAEGTEIFIRAEAKPEELQISVSDQGIGIPKGEYNKVFDRMYRIEQRLKNDPGGLGLGLSLCKALVEAHGGRIWVESKVGKGSIFYFTLPLKTRV